MSDTEQRQNTQAHQPVMCDDKDSHQSFDRETMQAHGVSSTPSMRLAGVVYVTTLYRCTIVTCRRVKTVTTEVRMSHP